MVRRRPAEGGGRELAITAYGSSPRASQERRRGSKENTREKNCKSSKKESDATTPGSKDQRKKKKGTFREGGSFYLRVSNETSKKRGKAGKEYPHRPRLES